MLSGKHGQWQVIDLSSRNGTFLNGNRIPAQQLVPLSAGDRLQFGKDPAVVSVAREARGARNNLAVRARA